MLDRADPGLRRRIRGKPPHLTGPRREALQHHRERSSTVRVHYQHPHPTPGATRGSCDHPVAPHRCPQRDGNRLAGEIPVHQPVDGGSGPTYPASRIERLLAGADDRILDCGDQRVRPRGGSVLPEPSEQFRRYHRLDIAAVDERLGGGVSVRVDRPLADDQPDATAVVELGDAVPPIGKPRLNVGTPERTLDRGPRSGPGMGAKRARSRAAAGSGYRSRRRFAPSSGRWPL